MKHSDQHTSQAFGSDNNLYLCRVKKELIITSTSNPRVKEVSGLDKVRNRKESGSFLIEGLREVRMAVKAGYKIDYFLRCPDILAQPDPVQSGAGEWLISSEVFSKLAVRENSGGLLAVAKMKSHGLETITPGSNSLFIVLESVEKPGNLGAILRTADAAGVDGVLVCDPQTDLYNPNIIRSGLGSLFTVPIGITDSFSAISFLKKHGISIYATYLEASVPYDSVDFQKSSAIVMGTEATGLSQEWLKASDQNIIIPMYGNVDSMNVSVSTAIVTFEAVRQRRSSGIEPSSKK